MRPIIAVLICCAAVTGCTSPETTRTRGGGPGADVGNRRGSVKMHEGSEPYWKTPERPGVQHPPLDPARQAHELSRH